jgi:hypothetical protein
METEPTLVARVGDFLWAVFWSWKALIAGLFLMTGPLLQLLPIQQREWLDKKYPSEIRRRYLLFASAFFIFVACFQAYDDANTRLRKVQNDLIRISNDRSKADEKEKTLLAIKEILGKAISDGETLLVDWQKADEKQLEPKVMALGTKADNFILAAFGAGEQALFESDAGYIFYGNGSRLSQIRNSVDGRVRRLNDLVQRSGGVPVRMDFDPSKFR